MNDLELAITATLRADAQEAAMSTDTAREAERLNRRLDDADRRRRRRTWIIVAAAAAAVVVAVVGVRALGARQAGEVVAPAPKAIPVTTTNLTPNLNVSLPAWTATAADLESNPGVQGWSQVDCSQQPDKKCPAGHDLRLRFFSVEAMYRPVDGPKVTAHPTYAQYVEHLKGLQAAGVATVGPPRPLTVGGRPATEFAVTPSVESPGALACITEFEAKPDCWGGLSVGRELRIVVIDQGAGVPPTVVSLGMNTGNPDQAARTAEFETALATVTFLK